MKKVLAIMPISIGGRLTTSSIIDGFRLNGFEIDIFDELTQENFNFNDEYEYIVGYDFSPVKLKIDYNLKFPCIAYFSDVIQKETSGIGFREYFKYLKNDDIYVFYWDRELAKKEGWNYFPHFVNCEIYKNFKEPEYDVLFCGRFDTDLRLKIFIELNKKLPDVSFCWHAIEKHYKNALDRLSKEEDRKIIKKAYKGFIDNEKDMADAINKAKIVYNINSQGVSSLNYRTIQTMACKRLLISDRRDELDLFDNILPVWENIDDLVLKIKYYLENKEEYDFMVKKSREFIELNHDSMTCVKKILDKIN